MSYYDDYVADGLCCESCGGYIGSTPGHSQFCDGCKPKPTKEAKRRAAKAKAA